MRFLGITFVFLLAVLVQAGDDYYELLGISRDANDRSIRKGFKKMALKFHPDKHPDDEEAHSKFIQINRAYEVLKDETLRKKYDEHGEEGLADNFQGGNKYQSYDFYQNKFGIYDDDVEIITLARGDFQQTVSESGQIWFVNFYSTFCSHCHELAPTWRDIAKEFEGIIRIGAVNCAEDPDLCMSQNIRGYPSLVLYPTGQIYNGERSFKKLSEFAMTKVVSEVHKVTFKNYLALSTEWVNYAGKGWILDFCDDEEQCISKVNKKKLAAMVSPMVNVGSVRCVEGDRDLLCKKIKDNGVGFFKSGKIDKDSMVQLNSLDPKEIANEVLDLLDDIDTLQQEEYNELVNNERETTQSYLVYFGLDSAKIEKDLKKLPFLFPNVHFRTVNCQDLADKCKQVYLGQNSRFVMFKSGGGYEVNFAKSNSIHETSIFIKESLKSNVYYLNPEEYAAAIDDGTMWMIDYFTSWCGPCLKLLNVMRSMPDDIMGNPIRIGTVDCDIHKDICQGLGISSYPTTILYYKGKKFTNVGFHQLPQILEFIEDALDPVVVAADDAIFEEIVVNREDGKMVLVDFFSPSCPPCIELAPQFRKLARLVRTDYPEFEFVTVDCMANQQLCSKHKVNSYPNIKLFNNNKGQPLEYPPHFWRDTNSMFTWLIRTIPSSVTPIGNNFESSVLNSAEPTLVDFFSPYCGPCINFEPVYNRIAKKLKGTVNVVKVDCNQHQHICQNAGVSAYPSIRYYIGSRNGETQNPYGIPLQTFDQHSIVSWVQDQLKQHITHIEL